MASFETQKPLRDLRGPMDLRDLPVLTGLRDPRDLLGPMRPMGLRGLPELMGLPDPLGLPCHPSAMPV
jgi:hypothetical protein